MAYVSEHVILFSIGLQKKKKNKRAVFPWADFFFFFFFVMHPEISSARWLCDSFQTLPFELNSI